MDWQASIQLPNYAFDSLIQSERRTKELNKKYYHGVKIEAVDQSGDIILCCNCFVPLIGQMGGWERINFKRIYFLDGDCHDLCCDVCGQLFTADRRCGLDRREYDYDTHVPERRTAARRSKR